MKLAFLVGCAQYDDPEISNLKYAGRDAEGFASCLKTVAGFQPDEVMILTSTAGQPTTRPTKSNILRELARLPADQPPESLVFFFSGHGFHSTRDGREYLIPEDAVFGLLEETCIAFAVVEQLIRRTQAKTVLLFIDTCRAPVAVGKSVAGASWLDIEIASLCLLGMASFCSCNSGERSFESDTFERGVFTFTLCEALSDLGRCRTVQDLDIYLAQRVPSLCREQALPIQHPLTRVEPPSVLEYTLVVEEVWSRWRSAVPVGREIRKPYPVDRSAALFQGNTSRGTLIAVDFGTSYSLVAGVTEEGQIAYVPSSAGTSLIPSAVSFFENFDYLVGRGAVERSQLSPEAFIQDVKRDLGSGKTYAVYGKTLRPEEVASLILRSLKTNAEEFFHCEIPKVLAAVPANFTIRQCNAMAEACRLAGLEIERLIGEPCAAGLTLISLQDLKTRVKPHDPEEIVGLVVDLGGGTFDVAVVEYGDLESGEIILEVKGVAGDNSLGGRDYDEALCAHLLTAIAGRVSGDPATSVGGRRRLLGEAERVKVALGFGEQTTAILHDIETQGVGFLTLQIPVDRDLFRELTRDLDRRVEDCIN